MTKGLSMNKCLWYNHLLHNSLELILEVLDLSDDNYAMFYGILLIAYGLISNTWWSLNFESQL